MQIAFERSGGFAGIKLNSQIDLDKLSQNEADTLRTCLDESGFFVLPSELKNKESQADRFCYKLTIKQGLKEHTIMATETCLPETLKPIIDFMQKKAKL